MPYPRMFVNNISLFPISSDWEVQNEGTISSANSLSEEGLFPAVAMAFSPCVFTWWKEEAKSLGSHFMCTDPTDED